MLHTRKGRENLLLLVPRRARGQLPLLLQAQVQIVCLTGMFTSSLIDHNTSIMTANAKAHSAFLPQRLELVPMTQFQSKLCTWPLSMKTPLQQRQSHWRLCCPRLHQGGRQGSRRSLHQRSSKLQQPTHPAQPALLQILEARRSSSCSERCLLNVLLVMWF